MDLIASRLDVTTVLVQVMKVARGLYDIHRNGQEIPEEILSVLIMLEDAQDLAGLCAKVWQVIPKMEYVDKKFAVLSILLS